MTNMSPWARALRRFSSHDTILVACPALEELSEGDLSSDQEYISTGVSNPLLWVYSGETLSST